MAQAQGDIFSAIASGLGIITGINTLVSGNQTGQQISQAGQQNFVANNNAINAVLQSYNQNRVDNAPYRAAGYSSINFLTDAMNPYGKSNFSSANGRPVNYVYPTYHDNSTPFSMNTSTGEISGGPQQTPTTAGASGSSGSSGSGIPINVVNGQGPNNVPVGQGGNIGGSGSGSGGSGGMSYSGYGVVVVPGRTINANANTVVWKDPATGQSIYGTPGDYLSTYGQSGGPRVQSLSSMSPQERTAFFGFDPMTGGAGGSGGGTGTSGNPPAGGVGGITINTGTPTQTNPQGISYSVPQPNGFINNYAPNGQLVSVTNPNAGYGGSNVTVWGPGVASGPGNFDAPRRPTNNAFTR